MTFPNLSAPKVTIHNGKAVTTSYAVAEYFDKQHKHVLAKIESLDCSVNFASANFSADVKKLDIGNGATRNSKYYEMTKDGFVFLVMGFTGKKAASFKEAYIAEFNRMESECHPDKYSSYQQHNREPIDNNDLANIKWLINTVTNRFKYSGKWNAAIWHSLRRATGTPSPIPFSIEDIPVLAEEFTRILTVTSSACELIGNFEKEVFKQVVRNRKDFDQIASQFKEEFESLQFLPKNIESLESFEKFGLARLANRTH